MTTPSGSSAGSWQGSLLDASDINTHALPHDGDCRVARPALIILIAVVFAAATSAQSVICHFCHCAVINTFITSCCPLFLTFASHCPVSLVQAVQHLHRSHRWLVVAFSARPAAYQLNQQDETLSCSHIWIYFNFLSLSTGLFYV